MKNRGLILINILIFAVIAVTVTIALINWAATMIKATRQLVSREQAFQIAESGAEYYRSYLAENPGDYAGSTQDFVDKDGNVIGQFILTITPPTSESGSVIVKSKGLTGDVSRTVQITIAVPSLAMYAIVSNDALNFPSGSEFFGPIHSNDEIIFDGVAHNLVTSSKENGVYTENGGIFHAGTKFPVDPVDFSNIAANLDSLKTAAQANGRHFEDSGDEGYHITLKANDTFDLHRVKQVSNENNNCREDGSHQDGWSTWDIVNEENLGNYPFPADGAIFLEDNVWVNGQIDTARLTIGSSRDIIVDNDLIYSNYDGQDAIGLIARRNVNIGLDSEDDLRIDGALVAQDGRVGRYYYSNKCIAGYSRATITLYGMIATYDRYNFSYDDGTGYQERFISYDPNLSFNPPPFFPSVSDQYVTVSWDEIK